MGVRCGGTLGVSGGYELAISSDAVAPLAKHTCHLSSASWACSNNPYQLPCFVPHQYTSPTVAVVCACFSAPAVSLRKNGVICPVPAILKARQEPAAQQTAGKGMVEHCGSPL